MDLYLLIPQPYYALIFILSPYEPSLDTVPLTYYDYPRAYDGNGVYAGVSATGAPLRNRENATLVMFAGNSDTDGTIQSVHEMEVRFNRKYKYPWVFLNDRPFSDDFKLCVLTPFLI